MGSHRGQAADSQVRDGTNPVIATPERLPRRVTQRRPEWNHTYSEGAAGAVGVLGAGSPAGGRRCVQGLYRGSVSVRRTGRLSFVTSNSIDLINHVYHNALLVYNTYSNSKLTSFFFNLKQPVAINVMMLPTKAFQIKQCRKKSIKFSFV